MRRLRNKSFVYITVDTHFSSSSSSSSFSPHIWHRTDHRAEGISTFQHEREKTFFSLKANEIFVSLSSTLSRLGWISGFRNLNDVCRWLLHPLSTATIKGERTPGPSSTSICICLDCIKDEARLLGLWHPVDHIGFNIEKITRRRKRIKSFIGILNHFVRQTTRLRSVPSFLIINAMMNFNSLDQIPNAMGEKKEVLSEAPAVNRTINKTPIKCYNVRRLAIEQDINSNPSRA